MDYGELKSAVSEWLARNDISAREETFIEFAHNKINRELRIRAQENAYAELIQDDGTVPVPDDFIEFRTIFTYPGTPGMVLVDAAVVNTYDRQDINLELVANNLRPLEIVSHETSWREFPKTRTGEPCVIVRVGNQFRVSPTEGTQQTVAGYYYRKFPALSDSNTSNWLTDNASEIYLFGALAEAAAYIKDVTQYMAWMSRFEQVIKDLKDEYMTERYAGSSLRQRIA